MALPPFDPDAQLDADSITPWPGLVVSADLLYDGLTARGWKLDREESNLLNGFSKTWRDYGLKVWVRLEKFVCAPPNGEDEALASVSFYRFDPDDLPETTMWALMVDPGDEERPRFKQWVEEWEWLLEHGDPNFDQNELLKPVPAREFPEEVRAELWEDLLASVVPAG